MDRKEEKLKILQRKIEECIQQEGYEIESIDVEFIHNSIIHSESHTGGQTVAELKIRVIKKYGILN